MLSRLADEPDAFLALQPRRIASTLKTRRDSVIVRASVGQHLILRGRLREGYAAYDSAGLAHDSAGLAFVQGPPHALILAVAGAMPRSVADSFFIRLAAESTFVARPLAYAWWYQSGDTLALRRAVDGLRDKATSTSAETQGLVAYARGVAMTYLLLARRDTTAALTTYRQLADSAIGRGLTPIRNDIARVLLARKDFRGAAQLLDARPTPGSSLYYWNMEWSLLRARAAAAMGDQARARELYGAVAAMWAKGDPELRPTIAEAQSGMR